MAIYHMEAKVITRGTGRTACGAAAYMSCSEIYNEYDGIQHDYTRKGGLVWEHVFLPPMAPAEWSDRAALWNAVEAAEKTKDSRLAREFIVALPVELDRAAWTELLTGFITENFIADGMCADVSIHRPKGHDHDNPHAHILLTVRPLDKTGAWQHKTEKEYLCVRNGEERGFTAAEFKTAQAEGWEKQYQYKTGRKKEYMAPSEAEKRRLERASKYPKATKFGRQNPISARWNSEEELRRWRAAWADAVNRALERNGVEQRVDHRGHAERGIDEKPTVHEGVNARIMEKMGYVSDRCELNHQIRADNALMRQLKNSIKKLTDALVTTLADMARAMEQLRQSMIILRYHLTHLRKRRSKAVEYLSKAEPMYRDYGELVRQIKEKSAERRSMKKELAALSPLSVFKRSELKKQIAQLSEEIEELTFSKNEIVTGFGKEDEKEMPAVPKQITAVKANVAKMDELEARYTGDIEKSGQEFDRLKERAKQYDLYDLTDARLALRLQMEDEAQERIKKDIPDEKLSFWDFQISTSMTDEQNREDRMETWYKEQTMRRRLEQECRQRWEQPQRKPRERDMER
ncbi:MAG: mobilization protein [Ruminococcaceae bacterium]|nr:mobilization protein [Oscillospiraceae bacterium]